MRALCQALGTHFCSQRASVQQESTQENKTLEKTGACGAALRCDNGTLGQPRTRNCVALTVGLSWAREPPARWASATRSVESLLEGPSRSTGSPSPRTAGFLPVPPVPLAGSGTQRDSRPCLTLAASSIYTPPPRPGLGAWAANVVEYGSLSCISPPRLMLCRPLAPTRCGQRTGNLPAMLRPPPPPPARLQRLCWDSAAVGGSAWRRWRWGECARERGPGPGAWVPQLLGK